MRKAFRAVAAVFVLGMLGPGCDASEPASGLRAGQRPYVSTPASGSNAQGRTPRRADSRAGQAQFSSRLCYYPDVTAPDRRATLAACTNTTEVGAGEGHGGAPAH